MIKQRNSNDASRLTLLVIAAAFIGQHTELTRKLSKKVCECVVLLAKSFSESYMDRNTKAAIQHEKIKERNALNRSLRFAIRDAYTGLIRRARRFGEPASTLTNILIPEKRARLALRTNQWFELARDLIAHNQRYEDDVALTNPTIEEMIDRLAKAEVCSWEADSAKELNTEALRTNAWNRVQADAVIRQLSAELNDILREQDRETRIAEMTNYGFKWAKAA